MPATPVTVHMEALPTKLRHAAAHLLETTLAPLALFAAGYATAGLTAGLLTALAWGVLALAIRLLRGAHVPAALLLTTGLLVVRTAIGLATGSAFLYFLQPSAQNFLIAALLLASLPAERTFLGRLADDFCALPASLTGNARVQRFFRRVSLLWALVFLANGASTMWALAQRSVGDFLVVSTAGSYALVGLAALASLLWFRRELRGEGIRLRFG